MQLLKIPLLTSTTDQFLDVTINDNPYTLRVLWNERFGYFSLSINDLNGDPILTNIKMVKNYPLTGRYKDTRLPNQNGGDFYLIQERGNADRPGYNSLGSEFALYFYEPDAVVSESAPEVSVSEPVLGTIWDSGLTEWDGGDTLWDQ